MWVQEGALDLLSPCPADRSGWPLGSGQSLREEGGGGGVRVWASALKRANGTFSKMFTPQVTSDLQTNTAGTTLRPQGTSQGRHRRPRTPGRAGRQELSPVQRVQTGAALGKTACDVPLTHTPARERKRRLTEKPAPGTHSVYSGFIINETGSNGGLPGRMGRSRMIRTWNHNGQH